MIAHKPDTLAAAQVIVEESGMPAMLMLRLKVADRKIADVETHVTGPGLKAPSSTSTRLRPWARLRT
jgi:hypothetical protein